MSNKQMADEKRLRVGEVGVAGTGGTNRPRESKVSAPIDIVSPAGTRELIGMVRKLSRALNGAVAALEAAGYTKETYCALDADERSSPTWMAVRRAWEATGKGPRYLLRFAPGPRQPVRIYPTKRAALEGAIEALEMCEGYPAAIELEGGARLMDTAEILRAWGDRHDPG